MKTKTITSAMAILIAFGMLTFSSCRKKKEEKQEEDTDTEQTSANDNNFAESTVNDIDAMGSDASENLSLASFKTSGDGDLGKITAAPCATVTVNLANHIITVDFGTTGCTGGDGRTRTGKLLYDYSGSTPSTAIHYRNPGFKMTVTSQNYVVDGNQVNITNKTVTNTTPSSLPTGMNPGTNLTWAISANVSIVKAGGGTITWSCNRTKELTNTSDTLCYRGQNRAINWSMAKVKLNGSASGTNAQGETYTSVATDLVRDFTCSPSALHPHRHPFISGTIAYTPGSRHSRLINYGSGTCDLAATVTINGNVYNITLQ